MNRHDIVSC